MRFVFKLLPALILMLPLSNAHSWNPVLVDVDPLVRMPGTQPNPNIPFVPPGDDANANACIGCHKGDPVAASDRGMPNFFWQGSMMAQAGRDPIFWATMTVAAQDSIWAIGRPNATDICLRCHFPEGWMSDRSDNGPNGTDGLNGDKMTGSDFDGVHCDICHKMYDPFSEATYNGTRGENGSAYWDEDPLSFNIASRVTQTLNADWTLSGVLDFFNGDNFYNNSTHLPLSQNYAENGSGQMFIDTSQVSPQMKRGPFADASVDVQNHDYFYSRYHKSKYFCGTCHDVSNPVLANLGADLATPLPSELNSAFSFGHVERTFSEFMSSAYGMYIGTATNQEFQDQGGSGIATAGKCQDCHMPDVNGVTAASGGGVLRPDDSTDHVNSGVPMHDLQGGNAWITYILASTDDSLTIYDQTNFDLLTQGPTVLTLDMSQGINPTIDSNGEALQASSQRALDQLARAATIKDLVYDAATGALSFKVLNNTGHKLLSGYPEGRRMFVNIKAFVDGEVVYEVNPYDNAAGTFKGGLSFWLYDGQGDVADPAALTANERYEDALVYEAVMKSDLTNEDHTFHFALGTDRYKDNRIPPKGFDLATARIRLCEPVASGAVKDDPATPGTNLYTDAEYAGGYDDVSTDIIAGADQVEVTLYYQGTSREYIEFLRDEITGTGSNRALYGPDNVVGTNNQTFAQANGLNTTVPADSAYLVQTDPFFSRLAAWGETMWELWYHNHGLDGSGPAVPGIVPVVMNQASVSTFSLASPNGGETLQGGSPVNVQWFAHPDATSYDLRLSYNGTDFWTVASGLSGTSYDLILPNNNAQAAVIRVVARNAGSWVGSDDSDGAFSIIKGGTLLTPNGGENIFGGSQRLIEWTADPNATTYDVRLSYDGGTKFWNIATGLTGTSFDWTVPNNNVGTAVIRIVSRNAGVWAGRDDSDGTFNIIKQ